MLPKQREQALKDLEARARLWDQGVDLTQPLPVEKGNLPWRTGHGSVSRWMKHQRDGEPACQACADAFHRYRYPQGLPTPDRWDDLFGLTPPENLGLV